MHATVSGLAEWMAETMRDGIRLAREVAGRLNWDPARDTGERAPAPAYDPEELLGIVPARLSQAYDVREVIARIVGCERLAGFQGGLWPATVCGFARVEGWPVGIIGNQWSDRSGRSHQGHAFHAGLRAVWNAPCLLQNTTGYIVVGPAAERGGIVKHGSKMIQAVTNAPVPKITMHIGASFGAGNYGMCGRAFGPRFIFAWPNNGSA